MAWPRGWVITALVAVVLFGILTVLVATHVTDHLDSSIRQRITPVGTWNETNRRLSDVPDYVSPGHMLALLVAVVAVIAWVRRSWLPVVMAGLALVVGAVPVVAVKWVLPRADTGSHVGASQGSFPSGHMVMTSVTVGCLLLLLVTRTRWWHWLLASLAPVAMAVCLLGGEIHWATDVVGGALLGVLAVSSAAVAQIWSRVTPGRPRSAGTAR